MKRMFVSLSFVMLVNVIFAHPSAFAVDPGIVAKIVETPVTVYELNREMQRILPMNSGYHGGISAEKISAIREKALMNLIDQGYKVQSALEQNITVSEEDLNQRLEKVHEKFTTKQALQKALGQEDLNNFYASVSRMLLAIKAEELAVGSRSRLSEAEIRSYYEQHKSSYNRPKQYRVSHILIKVDPTRITSDKEQARLKAERLAEQARSGKDFYNLAYYNSDDRTKMVGGDIGYFHSGQIVKEFEDAITGLNPGDIAGPVETLAGFHVIKLTEVNEARQLSFDEVKDKIRQAQEKKRYDLLYADWMAGLKKKYSHEIFLKPDKSSAEKINW